MQHSFIIYLFFFILLIGCKEDFDYNLSPADELSIIDINPPCDWKDTAAVGSPINRMGRWMSVDYYESFDYDEVRVSWGSSANQLRFKYNNGWGLQGINSGIIDYAEEQYEMEMYLRLSSSSSAYLYAKSGKLYIEHNKEKKEVTFTWCDISLQNQTIPSGLNSYGNATVKYE